jgi:hypothetical protein
VDEIEEIKKNENYSLLGRYAMAAEKHLPIFRRIT